MKASMFAKYGFRIRTRNGAIVENLAIFGRDESDAQRKLLQMYQGCEILATSQVAASGGGRTVPANYEDVVDLITTPMH